MSSLVEIDVSKLNPRELQQSLEQLGEDVTARLIGGPLPHGIHGLASGLSAAISLEVAGPAGDFFFFLGSSANVEIKGDVGACCGHSMVSGTVVVHGNVGPCAASYATGGFLATLGTAGPRVGLGLSGADVLIRSRAGDEAGMSMRSGVLVLGNGAGDGLGEGMTGGTIYVRGEVRSRAKHLRMMRMKDADAIRLSLLLARVGLKGERADFKAFQVADSKAAT